jgi:hypothetical protein
MQNAKQKILKAVSDIQLINPELADEFNELRSKDEVVSEAKKLAPKISHLNNGLEAAGVQVGQCLLFLTIQQCLNLLM